MKPGPAPPITTAWSKLSHNSYWRKQSTSSSRVAAVAISTITNAKFNVEGIIPATMEYAIDTVRQLQLNYSQRGSETTKRRDKFIVKEHTFGRKHRLFWCAVRMDDIVADKK